MCGERLRRTDGAAGLWRPWRDVVSALIRRRVPGLADIYCTMVVTQSTHEEIADAQAMLADMKRYESDQ